jgi:hypothetical protein
MFQGMLQGDSFVGQQGDSKIQLSMKWFYVRSKDAALQATDAAVICQWKIQLSMK